MGDASPEADKLMRAQGVRALPSFHFWKSANKLDSISGACIYIYIYIYINKYIYIPRFRNNIELDIHTEIDLVPLLKECQQARLDLRCEYRYLDTDLNLDTI